jgi:hypothetical protein
VTHDGSTQTRSLADDAARGMPCLPLWAASLTIETGLLHLSACSAHVREWWGYGVFLPGRRALPHHWRHRLARQEQPRAVPHGDRGHGGRAGQIARLQHRRFRRISGQALGRYGRAIPASARGLKRGNNVDPRDALVHGLGGPSTVGGLVGEGDDPGAKRLGIDQVQGHAMPFWKQTLALPQDDRELGGQ